MERAGKPALFVLGNAVLASPFGERPSALERPFHQRRRKDDVTAHGDADILDPLEAHALVEALRIQRGQRLEALGALRCGRAGAGREDGATDTAAGLVRIDGKVADMR